MADENTMKQKPTEDTSAISHSGDLVNTKNIYTNSAGETLQKIGKEENDAIGDDTITGGMNEESQDEVQQEQNSKEDIVAALDDAHSGEDET